MIHDRASWRMQVQRGALALIAAALPLACFNGEVDAQSFFRSPNMNIGPRTPSINPTVRLDPTIPDRGDSTGVETGTGTGRARARAHARTVDPVKRRDSGPRRDVPQTVLNLPYISNELVAEIDGSLSDAQADELARRHGLARLESQNFPLVGGTIGL
jgi:hypothetical protein